MCEGTDPLLQISSRHCWIVDFRDWLMGRGEEFPTPADAFNDELQAFIAAQGAGATPADGTLPYGYVWFDSTTGETLGTYVSFEVQLGSNASYVLGLWQDYVRIRNVNARSSANRAWMTSAAMGPATAASGVQPSLAFKAVALPILGIACIPALLLASAGIFVAMCVSGLSALALAVAGLVAIYGFELGVPAVMFFSVSFPMLTSAATRFALAYLEALNGPPALAASVRRWRSQVEKKRRAEERERAEAAEDDMVRPPAWARRKGSGDVGSGDSSTKPLSAAPDGFVVGPSGTTLDAEFFRSLSTDCPREPSIQPSTSWLEVTDGIGPILVEGPEGLWAERHERVLQALFAGGEAALVTLVVGGVSGLLAALAYPPGLAPLGWALSASVCGTVPIVLMLLPGLLSMGLGDTEAGALAFSELLSRKRGPRRTRHSGPPLLNGSLVSPEAERRQLAADVLGWPFDRVAGGTRKERTARKRARHSARAQGIQPLLTE